MSTYELIQHTEVAGAGVSQIEFASLPTDGTYTDLVLHLSLRTNAGAVRNQVNLQFNSSTASQSHTKILWYEGGSEGNTVSNIYVFATGNGAPSNAFNVSNLYFSNYANTSRYTHIDIQDTAPNNSTASYVTSLFGSGFTAGTQIANIKLVPDPAATILQYSTATLYGVLAGNDGSVVIS